MSSSIKVTNLRAALNERLFPTVTAFNRLEGRPRTRNFDEALAAEVRDPLWMLTKQWQMGEFRGSDAGSPVFAKLLVDTTRLTKYKPDGGATAAFTYDVPLEATVERRPIPLVSGGRPVALDIRMLMGRQWLALVKSAGNYRKAFVDRYPIAVPDPANPADAGVCAHPEVWQTVAAVAGRAMDGAALYVYLTGAAGRNASDGIALLFGADGPLIDALGPRFIAWFERLFLQPPQGGDDAWILDRLEYQFAASAPVAGGEKVYVADAYASGRLDWYSVDVDAATAALDPVPGTDTSGFPLAAARTMIPIPVSFAGMPNTRWWAFEDAKTNFGDIDASTTDLAKLMFLEFALVYANDWFVIPYTLPNGAVASIRGFAVTNTFGERFWIEAADRGADADWRRWSMFTIDVQGAPGAAADTSLVLLPTVASISESAPVEEILLVRDEAANMVWGVEKTVPLATGETKRGAEAATQTLAYFERLAGAAPPGVFPPAAPIRYRIMSTVPENWIPFVPVHVPGDNRTIQLQRAALPRILAGDPDPALPVKVQPRTHLLREGLDRTPARTYFVHEEEVPRAGARLTENYERTRWMGGRAFVWLRVRKGTGRGEGSSGLGFDEAVAT